MTRRILSTLLVAAGVCSAATEAETRLVDAVQKRDTAVIRTLLQQHSDVNAPQPDGSRALHWAAYEDDVALAEQLLAAGADAKAVNRYGVAPLSLACTNGNAAMVTLLLNAGADANSILPGGETALMTAARSGNLDVVRALLARGADVNAKEPRRGQTAIMWAAAEGQTAVVEALIQAGADFRARLDSGYTPLLFAVREGQIDAVKTLLKAGADVNDTVPPRNSNAKRTSQNRGGLPVGTTALHLAVANAHYELAAFLLDAGANSNAIGTGWAPIHTITWVRKPGGGDNDPAPRGSGTMTSLEFLKVLAAHGANLNARITRKVGVGLTSLNTNGATAYLLAARTADAELMRALVALGADPKIPNVDNSTAIIVAAGLGTRSPGEDAGTESEVVEALQTALEQGADINAVDNNGETAMHGAAYKNLPGAVLFLADKGADITVWNKKNSHGWTPLTIAEGYRFGNYKPSPETVAAFHKVMKAAGVPIIVTPPPGTPGKNSDYAKP